MNGELTLSHIKDFEQALCGIDISNPYISEQLNSHLTNLNNDLDKATRILVNSAIADENSIDAFRCSNKCVICGNLFVTYKTWFILGDPLSKVCGQNCMDSFIKTRKSLKLNSTES